MRVELLRNESDEERTARESREAETETKRRWRCMGAALNPYVPNTLDAKLAALKLAAM